MSDPMTNVEIEDVLSSIRRLVSEDVRSQAVRRPDDDASLPPALVLTPAQRIEEPADEGETARETAEAWDRDRADEEATLSLEAEGQGPVADEAAPPGPPIYLEDIASLERTISELEAAVAGIDEDFEPDTGESIASGSDEADLHEMFNGSDDNGSVTEARDDRTEKPDDAPETNQDDPVETAAETDVHAEADWAAGRPDEVADAADQAEWAIGLDAALTDGTIAGGRDVAAPDEIDALVDSTGPDLTDADDAWLAEAGDAFADAASDPEPDAREDTGTEAEDPAGQSVQTSLADGAVVVSAATAARLPRLHLSGASRTDAGEDTAQQDDAAESVGYDTEARAPRIIRAVSSEPTAADPQHIANDSDGSALPNPNLFEDGNEALLDADALRDLIVEIIRQELQGALGERITRNVRKLVRREILRVLETRDLE